ncbi:MAG: DISARM system SNF2-like helicase DrmD [Polyangiaceae bacterium]
MTPREGALVRVRQRTYLVERVIDAPSASPVLSLACVDDDAPGERLDVVWSIEPDARELAPPTSAAQPAKGPDDAKTFAAYLLAQRWAAITSTEADLLQSPLRAGIVPQTYQLEPLRMALRLPRVNLFIADDVGLGKTIEAGLVMQELLLRNRIDRVVVACPAAVVLQWRDEMFERFGLSFAVYGQRFVAAVRKERGFRANPWEASRFFLISHSLLRDPDIAAGLRRTLGEHRARSLFILDEAHAAAPSSASTLARDSDTTKAVRDLARRFEHRLFLSATPHNGHSGSFSALMEILDPQRFTRHVPITNRRLLREVMVRRLKTDLEAHTRAPIPKRIVETIEIRDLPEDAPELTLAAKLHDYVEDLAARAKGTPRAETAAHLVSSQLQTRLLSSIAAFARTLRVHAKSAGGKWLAALPPAEPAQPTPQLALFDAGSEADAERADAERADAEAQAHDDRDLDRASRDVAPAVTKSAGDLLREMITIADRHRHTPDARVKALLAWLRDHACPDLPVNGPATRRLAWKPRRILVFTEFTDTLLYLAAQLRAAFGEHEDPGRILTFDGDTDDDDREQIKAHFNDPAHPVRVLLATDAAREGLNLQKACADLFHFDLPWNPARLEQRCGRIDRLMQPAKEVRCWSFFYAQRPEDRVLRALVRKTDVIRGELGAMAEVLGVRVTRLFSRGIRRDEADAMERDVDGLDAAAPGKTDRDAELETVRDTRDIPAQIATLQRLHQKASEHVGLDPDRLLDVVNLGLTLAGKGALQPIPGAPDLLRVPPLAEGKGADPTWLELEDRLRPPRPPKTKPWEWRAETPMRPVTFRSSAVEELPESGPAPVLLHLEHTLVRRALATFRAQGFGEDRLARWTVAVDPTYKRHRVLALGRLSIFGAGATRLHEELIPVTSLWIEGDDPARLQAFRTAEADEKAVAALSEVLARPQRPLPDSVIEKLRAHAARDEEALFAQLQLRAEARIEQATKALAARAEQEAAAMTTILTTQKQSIADLLQRTKQLQLPGLVEEDVLQRDADLRYLQARLVAIDGELRTEPSRIQKAYEVSHFRVTPVGLVYLWAETA